MSWLTYFGIDVGSNSLGPCGIENTGSAIASNRIAVERIIADFFRFFKFIIFHFIPLKNFPQLGVYNSVIKINVYTVLHCTHIKYIHNFFE